MASPRPSRETDLYPPLKAFLKAGGYRVRAEVDDCDVVATKGDELIVVEMKLRFSLELLLQAVQRQKVSSSVYVAVPGPLDMSRRGPWKARRHLLRRLELGLIQVLLGTDPYVEIVEHPLPYQSKRSGSKKRHLLKEAQQRSEDLNLGGSTRTKLVTAYREMAIQIACLLSSGGMTPKQLREKGTGPKTQSILYSDYYGWFCREGKGAYSLTTLGRQEMETYPELRRKYLTSGRAS